MRMLKVLLFLVLSSFVVAEWDLEWVLQEHDKMLLEYKELQTVLEKDQPNVIPHDSWFVQVKEGSDVHQIAESMGMKAKKNYYGYWLVEPTDELKLTKRTELATFVEQSLSIHPEITHMERQNLKLYKPRQIPDIKDQNYSQQWHLKGDKFALNVLPLWEQGKRGEGITVCVVDDGVEWTHPDLKPNYNAEGSFDYQELDPDPNPGINLVDNHGTQCAGVIAAANDGKVCGVGIAFKGKFSAIRATSRLLPQRETTIVDSLSHRTDINSVFSNSWGVSPCRPAVAGGTCDLIEIASPVRAMLFNQTAKGRNGKGTIYVFAAGNDRQLGSDVNYQDMARQIQVINVAAHGKDGKFATYSDPGAAIFVSAPSRAPGQLGIVTTDRNDLPELGKVPNSDCTDTFEGTSASAPMVAAIIGLVLQSFPDLTWRDVQDILVKSAVPDVDAIPDYKGWQKTGGDRYYSHDFGFGRIDAEQVMREATYRTGASLTCSEAVATSIWKVNVPIPDMGNATSAKTVSGVTAVTQIEQVLIVVNIVHPARGQLAIILKSPSGLQTILARKRNDVSAHYSTWVFRSIAYWDEDPNGPWELEVRDLLPNGDGFIVDWQLIFYGKCPGEEPGLTNGQIVGIVIGSIAGVAVIGIVVALVLFVKKRE